MFADISPDLPDNECSFDDVFPGILDQTPITASDALSLEKTTLSDRPIVDSKIFSGLMRGEQISTFSWVALKYIIGRPFADSHPGGWSFEYGNRQGRILEEANALLSGDEQQILRIFHPGEPAERIKLFAIDGPSGPLYSVEDGTHRVAASMLAGLHEIPCNVARTKYPLSLTAIDNTEAIDWQNLIDKGLLEGTLSTLSTGGRNEYNIVITHEVLPWIRAPQRALNLISIAYEKLYPGSLDNLKIPRDALVDPIANNHFMDGKWDKWLQKKSP